MQKVSLNVNLRDGTDNNWQNIPLPCPLSAEGCDSTSTDPFAYNWDEPNNCLFTIIRTFDTQMVKTNDKYYIVKYPKLTSAQFSTYKALCSKFIMNHSLYVVIHK